MSDPVIALRTYCTVYACDIFLTVMHVPDLTLILGPSLSLLYPHVLFTCQTSKQYVVKATFRSIELAHM